VFNRHCRKHRRVAWVFQVCYSVGRGFLHDSVSNAPDRRPEPGVRSFYHPAHSASSLAVYKRGHLSGPEIFRFGRWMTLMAYLVVLVVALLYWAAVGEPPVVRSGE
jgi:hypothetical protein